MTNQYHQQDCVLASEDEETLLNIDPITKRKVKWVTNEQENTYLTDASESEENLTLEKYLGMKKDTNGKPSYGKTRKTKKYLRNEPCQKCHKKGHDTKACWKDKKCFICKKQGHIARVCRQKIVQTKTPQEWG